MSKTLVILASAAAFAFAAVHFATGPVDGLLGRDQMSVLYGGGTAPAPNTMCCITDPTCQSTSTSCSGYNGDQAGCTGGAKPYFNTTYAKKCGQPATPCATCDCTNYVKDSAGLTYDCIDWYNCNYSSVTGLCTKGTYSASTPGTYSCASNC